MQKLSKIVKKQFSAHWKTSLKDKDPLLYNLIQNEKLRQKESINLIASENYTPQSVLDALGSPLQNKYSEGYPHHRYYGGNDYIDQIEELAQQRALDLFRLDSKSWGVNVQTYSGSPANLSVYAGLLNIGDAAVGLQLSSGGHLSHGFFLPSKKVHWTSKLFDWDHYETNDDSLLDYDLIEKVVLQHKPKLVVAGYSAYPAHYDYKKMREICDKVGAILLSDMAHISGQVAAQVAPDPFKYSHVVTTTTHKTLRGPRGAIIFARKDVNGEDFNKKINEIVFPGMQGGPHNHTIGAIATCLLDAKSDEFVEYQKQTIKNAKALSEKLMGLGLEIVTGGTENHIVLMSLRNKEIDGGRVEYVFNALNISTNKNTIKGDLSALKPTGMRLGSPPMTTRDCKEKEFEQIAEFINRGIGLSQKYNTFKKLVNFKKKIDKNQFVDKEFITLKKEIKEFSSSFAYDYK